MKHRRNAFFRRQHPAQQTPQLIGFTFPASTLAGTDQRRSERSYGECRYFSRKHPNILVCEGFEAAIVVIPVFQEKTSRVRFDSFICRSWRQAGMPACLVGEFSHSSVVYYVEISTFLVRTVLTTYGTSTCANDKLVPTVS
jgi:hypothetical protein